MEFGATFYESLALAELYQRRTASLNEQALAYASENSFTMTGRMSGISTSRLLRLFDERELPPKTYVTEIMNSKLTQVTNNSKQL